MAELDYTAIERKIEADMVRTELEPTLGGWHIWLENYHYVAEQGRCCLFSPQLLGSPFDWDNFVSQVSIKLGVSRDWVQAAIDGFDNVGHSGPGYAFGAEMRRKYVLDKSSTEKI